MNQAVISCLHANLPAVEAVLKDIELQGITNITCLGDLVGYGPQPNEVIELIRDKIISSCQGCWDEDVVDGLDACDCSYPSQLAEKRGHFAHQWTTDKLTKENNKSPNSSSLPLFNLIACFNSSNSSSTLSITFFISSQSKPTPAAFS